MCELMICGTCYGEQGIGDDGPVVVGGIASCVECSEAIRADPREILLSTLDRVEDPQPGGLEAILFALIDGGLL